MGAGHDGAARELALRLRAGGHDAEVRDFLDSGPLRVGAALRRGYEFELKHVPSAYDVTYRLWYRLPWLCPVVTWLVTALTRRRVQRWVRRAGADVVVSTYPLATLCLGRMRATGRLRVPAVNFITDFGVHPLWVHRGVDVNLAVHDAPAAAAARRGGRPSIACGPAVSPAFEREALPDREAARAGLGLGSGERAVLVVAGSWGVGGVEAAWRALSRGGRFTPVVVCGRDERLRRHVSALASSAPGNSVVLGWTDAMPALMAACDALVENAGGLTSLEAMRAGLPVVSFQPIAGHGKENTLAMAAAGISRLAADAAGLLEALEELTASGPARTEQVEAARGLFRGDPAGLVLDAASAPALQPGARRRRAVSVATRVAAALTGLAGLGWLGLTSGVAMAAEAGAGVAHPAAGASSVVYVGVRLDVAELASPAVAATLRDLNLTAIVDRETALADPSAVRGLAAAGVDVASGGQGDWIGAESPTAPWDRAQSDARAAREIEQLTGAETDVVVPGRRVNMWDLIAFRHAHSSVVVPDHVIDAGPAAAAQDPLHLKPRDIYLINGLGSTAADLDGVLGRLRAGLHEAHLAALPLVDLT